MAGSVNKVIVMGNLGKDPEIRTSQDGQKICNLTLATSESWVDKGSGERKERTEWHRIVIFNDRLADVAERFLKKGKSVYLEGALQTRKWSDKDGQDRYTTEIVLTRFRGELVLMDTNRDKDIGSDKPSVGRSSSLPPRNNGRQGGGDLDDEIPF